MHMTFETKRVHTRVIIFFFLCSGCRQCRATAQKCDGYEHLAKIVALLFGTNNANTICLQQAEYYFARKVDWSVTFY